MKLLIVTQTVDKNDPVLGFFHRWIEEFSKHFEHIVVIGNSTGVYELPQNVEVHSLGKFPSMPGVAPTRSPLERTVRSLRYLGLLWKHRARYDAVLVHMTPEHLVLGGPLFRLMKKKAFLWYNHTVASPWLSRAARFASRVFHTSPYAATARFPNAHRMPAGIDTDLFKPRGVKKIPKSVYFQGRVAPAKKVHVLLEAFALLHEKNDADKLTIVGPEDVSYTKPLKEKYRELIKRGIITFLGPREYASTPELYESHTVSVNLTDRGNYDKTVLESMACGTPAVVSSDAFSELVPKELMFREGDARSLADVLERFMNLPESKRNALSKKGQSAVRAQSLPELASRLKDSLSSSFRNERVLFLINKLKVGGSEKLFREEREALEQDGIPSYLAPLYDTKLPHDVREEFVFLPRFKNLFDIEGYKRVLSFIKKNDITVIHATLEHASIAARIMGFFLPGVRIAISEPGMADRKPLRYKLVDILLNLRTNVLIAGSHNVKRSLARYQPFYRSKIVIVMNGVYVPEKLPARKEDKTFTILAIGSLRPEKGFDVLIRAFGRFIQQTGADARLVIVGKGALEKDLTQEAADVGVANSVTFVGEQSEEKVADWQKQSHVFAMSSVSEGGPFVLLEAMAAGTPIVASSVGCVPDIMTDGIEGLVVNPGDGNALAAALIRMYREPSLRSRLAKAAFAKVKEAGTFKRHMTLLKQALGILI